MSPTPATVRSTVSRSSRTMDETTVSSAPKEIAADRLTAFKASLTKLFKEVCCVIVMLINHICQGMIAQI